MANGQWLIAKKNMKNHRIFVEKYARFQVEAESLRKELNENLSLAIESLRVLNVYDLFGFSDELVERCRYSVFGEIVTDLVSDECDYEGKKFLAIEYLPGQFDQRASSAVDCVHLLEPAAEVKIRSSRLYIFDDGVTEEQMAKILVVDDESRMRKLVSDFLIRSNYQVLEAADGEEAINKFTELKPDVIILDITMPNTDGIEALKRIKAIDPAAKIIICSAVGQPAIIAKAIESGAREFIVKPFESAHLLAAIEKIMRN